MEQFFSERCRLDEAMYIAETIYSDLKGLEGVQEISVAGSFATGRAETIGDVDILISCGRGIHDLYFLSPLPITNPLLRFLEKAIILKASSSEQRKGARLISV